MAEGKKNTYFLNGTISGTMGFHFKSLLIVPLISGNFPDYFIKARDQVRIFVMISKPTLNCL